MVHMDRATSKNLLRWIRTTATHLQTQINNLTSNAINPIVYSLMQTRSTDAPNNQFITTREAEILAKYVEYSPDKISIYAIGGNTAYFFVKRIIDLIIATIMIILSLPMLIICAVWVAIENNGSVISRKQEFTSRLVQQDSQYVWIVVPFTRYEFLTSTENFFGQFLQMTGLKALPTLFNVIRDDMSMIGSQTLTQEEIEAFEDWQFLSFASKPGIIGLAHISGKFSWLANDQSRQQVWYACSQGFSVDMKILVKTFQAVVAI